MRIKTMLTVMLPASILFFTACGNKTGDKANEEDVAKKSYVEKQTVKVSVEKVRKGDFARELISNGKLAAKEKAIVPFRVQEIIADVRVRNGQRVKKGDVLALVDAYKYKKKLDDSRTLYEKALIDLEDRLLSHGYSLSDTARVPAHILKMSKIRSGYNQAVSNLNDAKRDFENTRITAPISGIVANLEAKPENMTSQYKKCCEIINDKTLIVSFPVLEGEIDRIAEGQKVEVIPFAMQNSSFTGIITSVNPTVDEHGMIQIEGLVENPGGKLIDGMNVKVLVKNIVHNCIIIPKTAVLYRQNRKVVFINDNNIAKWVYVVTGLENSSEVTITDNILKPGQEVIVSNNINLAHETPVTVNSEQ